MTARRSFGRSRADVRSARLGLQAHGVNRSHLVTLLPQERLDLVEALVHAVRDGAADASDALWLLFELSEAPERGVVWTWLIEPEWQERHPLGATRFGRHAFARWLRRTGIASARLLDTMKWPEPMDAADQLRLLARRSEPPDVVLPFTNRTKANAFMDRVAAEHSEPAVRQWLGERDRGGVAERLCEPGMNVLGHFSYPSGLRTSAQALIDGARTAGVPVSGRNVPVDPSTDAPYPGQWLGVETHDVSVIHVQPEPFFPTARERARLATEGSRPYTIGLWYWEIDEIPESWDGSARMCDELWTATRFVGDALRARYDRPVREIMPALTLRPAEPLPRQRFGLPEDAFVFLFTFHMTSVMERKNPLGLIRAFDTAFHGRSDVHLVVKTSFGERHPEELARLRVAAADNVHVIDEVYTNEEIHGLMACADAYVSLHRSEGLGLTMAEAMLLGRPVVATRYSGNLDFMDDENSLLVNCWIVRSDRAVPPYGDTPRWAEPDIEHAAQQMRRLVSDREWARQLGERGRAHLAERFNAERTGREVRQRLAEIAAMRGGSHVGHAGLQPPRPRTSETAHT